MKKVIKSIVNFFDNIISNCIYFFTRKSVKNNKIFFISYYGSQLNDNPFAIYKKLLESGKCYKFVWAYNKKHKKEQNTTFVKNRNFFNFRLKYHLWTSKIIINNCRFTFDIKKKSNQFYIQTWHAFMGLKKIEKDAAEFLNKEYIKNAIIDSSYINILLSGCEYKKESYKQNFWYNGEILEIGTPRCDTFFDIQNTNISEIKKTLGMSNDERIILYMPTFRANKINYLDLEMLESIKMVLCQKFSKDFKIVLKLHPNDLRKIKDLKSSLIRKGFIDACLIEDTENLLKAADILITDYSSVMFDFSLMRKPCFLYIPDYNDYYTNERSFMYDLKSLPFPSFKDANELKTCLDLYDENLYIKELDSFFKRINLYENGKATFEICSLIERIVNDGR